MRPEQIPGTLFVILLAWMTAETPQSESIFFLIILATALAWLSFLHPYAWFGAIAAYSLAVFFLGYKVLI